MPTNNKITQLTSVTPTTDDIIPVVDLSDPTVTKKAALSDLPLSTAATSALNAKVDTTTTVNWKSLSSNISLTTDDVTEWATNKYDQVVSLLAWAWIQVTWTYPNFTVTNSSPDQIVALTAWTNVTITGTYPNFTINSTWWWGWTPATTVVSETSFWQSTAVWTSTNYAREDHTHWTPAAQDLSWLVPKTTTVNSKALNTNITLTASDVWAEPTLLFTPENVANKENTTLDISSTKYPTNNLVKTYVDTANWIQDTTISWKQIYHWIEWQVRNAFPTNTTTTTLTLTFSTTPVTYWRNWVKTIVNVDKSVTHSATAWLYWIYFDDDGTWDLVASTTFPWADSATTTKVIIASIDWNGTDYWIINYEGHLFNRNWPDHIWKHSTVGCRYKSWLTMTVTGTGATSTGAVTSGNIMDEDIDFPISAQTTFRQRYQTWATTSWYDTAVTTTPVKLGANNRPWMVDSTSYVWTQVASATNRYVNYFVYASTTMLAPIHVFSETASTARITANWYTSLANARAVPFPNISYYGLSAEFRPIYRIICRADGLMQAIDTTLDDYRTVSSLPQWAWTSSTTAAAVSFAPAWNIAATTVQTAIEELDTEKLATTWFDENLDDYHTSWATWDIWYRDSNGKVVRLWIGSTDNVLKVTAWLPAWWAASWGWSQSEPLADYQWQWVIWVLGVYTFTTAKTLSRCTIDVSSIPVWSNCIVELRKNSFTSWNILNATLQVATSDTLTNWKKTVSITSFTNASVAAWDYVVAYLTSVGSTTPAQDPVVYIDFA